MMTIVTLATETGQAGEVIEGESDGEVIEEEPGGEVIEEDPAREVIEEESHVKIIEKEPTREVIEEVVRGEASTEGAVGANGKEAGYVEMEKLEKLTTC